MPEGLPWQEPDGGWGDASAGPTCTPRSTPRAAGPRPRGDFDAAYGDWDVLRDATCAAPRAGAAPGASTLTAEVAAALRQAERDPAGLSDARRWP